MRRVSDNRYEQLRQIGADIIEDYAVTYPFKPMLLAQKFNVKVTYYDQHELFNALNAQHTFVDLSYCGAGFTARFTQKGDVSYHISLEKEASPQRNKFTLAHELSHVILNHHGERKENQELEQEANFLASFLIMPEVIGCQLFEPQNINAIQKFCSVSYECALNIDARIQRIRKLPLAPLNNYEKQILKCVNIEALKTLLKQDT